MLGVSLDVFALNVLYLKRKHGGHGIDSSEAPGYRQGPTKFFSAYKRGIFAMRAYKIPRPALYHSSTTVF